MPTRSRENFTRTMVISCFSFTEAAKRAARLMPNGGAMLTLTFNGGERTMPNYNVMGLAKAALEASVRYLAVDFGRDSIRVNAISAGPIRTLAGAGIGDARAMFAFQQRHSPLRSRRDARGSRRRGALSAVGPVRRRDRRNPFRRFRLQRHLDAASRCAEDVDDANRRRGARRRPRRRAISRPSAKYPIVSNNAACPPKR